MEQKNHNHNGFGNGFVLGLLIGVIVTLLVTTKKGRELFKEFTEKGLDKFSDLEKKLQDSQDEFEEFDDKDDYVAPESIKEVRHLTQVEKKEDNRNGNGTRKPSRTHRFFRSKKI